MKKITHCRACGSKALTPVIKTVEGKTRGGIDYVLCDPSLHARACGLMQSSRAGVSPAPAPSARHASTRDHLRALATESLELLSGRDCAALDIGCNDGSLLSYYPRWVDRYGVDPSAHVEEVGKWAWSARAAFPSDELNKSFGDKKFDIITSASVLEHIDDPRAFLSAVKERLTGDGVFALETLYAPMVLTRNAIDTLHAGAVAIYSLSVLEWLVRSEGLKVIKGTLTSKDGGSIRLFITHQDNDEYDFDPWSERLAKLWDEENALALRAQQPYQSFEHRRHAMRHETAVMFGNIKGRGDNVHILGADAYSDALISLLGPSAKSITAVVDTHGARDMDTLGKTGLPVISETDSRAAEPDYLLAPARFKRELLERWRETILLGAKMIFLTPTPHEVNSANYASEYGKVIAGAENTGTTETLRSILAAAGGLRLVADNPDRKDAASSG